METTVATEKLLAKKVTRRKFLASLLCLCGLSSWAMVDFKLTAPGAERFTITLTKALIEAGKKISEASNYFLESFNDHRHDIVGIKTQSVEVETREFDVSKLSLNIKLNPPTETGFVEKNTHATLIELKAARASIVPAPQNRREKIVDQSQQSGNVVVGPVGFVSSPDGSVEYFGGELSNATIEMVSPARTSQGHDYGIVDQFANAPESIWYKLGGFYIDTHGQIVVCSDINFINAIRAGLPFANLPIVLHRHDYQQKLTDTTIIKKFGQGATINLGDFCYFWTAYIQVRAAEQTKTYILAPTFIQGREFKDFLALWHVVEIAKQLAGQDDFSIGIADGGNGGTVFYKTQGDEQVYGCGVLPENTHYSPLGVVFS